MLEYKIIRSRRKTISIQITPEGQTIVRCPERMADTDIHRHVFSKRQWIENHLAALSRRQIQPPFTPEEIRGLVKQAKQIIPPRVEYHARKIGVSYGRIAIRSQHSRWGSCSGKGNLNFNCLLTLAPPEVLDYVVIHELCHRKQMNHSSAFWAEVARHCPDYAAAKAWLKSGGSALIARLPK